jgi:hypothetical protein
MRPRRHTSIHSQNGHRDSDAAGLTSNGLSMNGGGGYPQGGYSTAPIDTTPQKMEQSASARTGLGSIPSGRGLEEGAMQMPSPQGDHQYKYRAK